jgi:hypothetical protein
VKDNLPREVSYLQIKMVRNMMNWFSRCYIYNGCG